MVGFSKRDTETHEGAGEPGPLPYIRTKDAVKRMDSVIGVQDWAAYQATEKKGTKS